MLKGYQYKEIGTEVKPVKKSKPTAKAKAKGAEKETAKKSAKKETKSAKADK